MAVFHRRYQLICELTFNGWEKRKGVKRQKRWCTSSTDYNVKREKTQKHETQTYFWLYILCVRIVTLTLSPSGGSGSWSTLRWMSSNQANRSCDFLLYWYHWGAMASAFLFLSTRRSYTHTHTHTRTETSQELTRKQVIKSFKFQFDPHCVAFNKLKNNQKMW